MAVFINNANQELTLMGIIGQRPILLVAYISNASVLLGSAQSH